MNCAMSLLLAAYFDNLWNRLNGEINGWTMVGLLGNAIFSSRFFIQWYVSEKKGESTIPISFWYLSMAGSLVLTVYAIHIGAVPMVLGTLPPMFIYMRNLYLIAKGKRPGGKGASAEVAEKQARAQQATVSDD
jgi:lipid-A-disaccharide synthase-like uncharacterized protein